jgi:hypothetical protein
MTMTNQLQTPVALFIFNRPEPTRQVFAAIRQARPTRLLLVADGPRPQRPGEAAWCAAARAVVAAVDWPCEVLTNFSVHNLGCRKRISSGLDWVFNTVEEAIILEDDCLPHPDFFPFCAELLARYRNDDRVMHVGGDNFQYGQRHGEASYYFSRYPHIWGWATWRRAWRHYDVDMARWPTTRARVLADITHRGERRFWDQAWSQVAEGRIDTWDYQWAFACAERGGLAVNPNVNLVTNVGFGALATHTVESNPGANLPVEPLVWPLIHPETILRATIADDRTRRIFFTPPGMQSRIRRKLKMYVQKIGHSR